MGIGEWKGVPPGGDAFALQLLNSFNAQRLPDIEAHGQGIQLGDDPQTALGVVSVVDLSGEGDDDVVDIVDRELGEPLIHRLHHCEIAAIGLHDHADVPVFPHGASDHVAHGVPDRTLRQGRNGDRLCRRGSHRKGQNGGAMDQRLHKVHVFLP